MSQTLTPPPQPYNKWLTDTLAEIGARMPHKGTAPVTLQPGGGNARPRIAQPQGKGRSLIPGAGKIRTMVFGDPDQRHAIDSTIQGKIDSLRDDGLAAPVQIASDNRTLSGNFYSAAGHNLKGNNGQPDLSRPLVLLLTGSHGSAEDQGFEMSQFYAKGGASVLSVNYGGFGGSTGDTPTEDSVLKDAHAMLQHAVDLGYDPGNIIIHGYSLGGAVAGNVKETAEAGGAKFRGLVLDRPMLSVAHGIESHMLPGLRKLAGQIGRKAMGKMSARSVISASQNTDTRMVVTSDDDYFADRADGFRARLANDGQGRVVSGVRSNAGHDAHDEMIKANASHLTQLITQDRQGAPQQVQSGNGSAHRLWNDMIVEVNGALQILGADTADMTKRVTTLQGAVPAAQPGVIRSAIAKAEMSVRSGLDIIRFATLKPWQDRARREVATLEQCLTTLADLLKAAGDDRDSPAMLVEAKRERAKEAVAALAAAGGPPNRPLEDAVLAVESEVRRLKGSGTQAVLAELASTVLLIEQSRASRARRVRVRRGAMGPGFLGRQPAVQGATQASAT